MCCGKPPLEETDVSAPPAKPVQALVALVLIVALGVPGVGGYTAYSLAKAERSQPDPGPASLGLAYEDVSFPSQVDALDLRGWYMPARPAESSRSVVLVHGRNGHRADSGIGLLPLAAALVDRGYNVLAFDLRGHGESAGEHLSFGYFERRDLQGAIDHLEARGEPGSWVGAIGFSMGAATVLLTAPDDERIRAAVVHGGYAAIGELIERELPGASGLPAFFTPVTTFMGKALLGLDLDAVRPEDTVGGIAPRPLLIVHGTADDMVPVEHARRLAAANPQASLWILDGVGHVRAYREQPEEFLRRVEETFARAQR